MAKDLPKFPYVRVVAPSVHYAVECAGRFWAGTSELPKDQFTAVELELLKVDPRLKVEEFERPHVIPAAA